VVLTFAHDETKEKIRFSTEEFDEKIKTNS
jgi:hypothetical protein